VTLRSSVMDLRDICTFTFFNFLFVTGVCAAVSPVKNATANVAELLFRRNRSSASDLAYPFLRLSSVCRLSHSYTVIKPFEGFACHLAETHDVGVQ